MYVRVGALCDGAPDCETERRAVLEDVGEAVTCCDAVVAADIDAVPLGLKRALFEAEELLTDDSDCAEDKLALALPVPVRDEDADFMDDDVTPRDMVVRAEALALALDDGERETDTLPQDDGVVLAERLGRAEALPEVVSVPAAAASPDVAVGSKDPMALKLCVRVAADVGDAQALALGD